MKHNNRLPFNLPPKQMAIVAGFALIYDFLMISIGYGHLSFYGAVALFGFGFLFLLFQKDSIAIKKKWEVIKQFFRSTNQ